MNTGQVVRNAAKMIEKHGWIQGALGSHASGFCIAGAVAAVTTPAIQNGFDSNIRQKTFDEFTKWLRELESMNLFIPEWNDKEGRTKEEVLLYMNKFADEMDPQ